MMNIESFDVSTVTLSIDKEGNWRHEGVKVTHQKTVKLFFSVLDRDDQGRYFIEVGKERAFVRVNDVPFIVTALRLLKAGIRLTFQDGTRELLLPETLQFTKENIPYCKIRQGKMDAKFSRTAYYELAEFIVEQGEGFALKINDKLHPLETPAMD